MINQDHAPAWFQRGLLYLDWGKEEAAISDLVTATKVDPNHLDAHLHLAAIHHESERFDQASDAWRAALAIDGEHTVAKKRLEESESAILASI
jgi:Tfp pilus assembly protein PilF